MSPKPRADTIDLDELKVNNLERPLDERGPPRPGTKEWLAWRLQQAFLTLDALPDSARPRGFGRAMPAYVHDALDLWYQRMQADDERRQNNEHRNRVRLRPSAVAISEMHEAFDWLARLRRAEPGAATVLQAWALATARRYNLRRLCRNRQWSYSGFHRKRERGLTLLLDLINFERP